MLGNGCDGLALGGVDLDACRDPTSGALAPWAEEVRARLATYAEVSPSGKGIKLFFGFDPSALPALRAAMGAAPGEVRCGRKWAWSGADHGPAIELYLGGRFFAVTDERLPDAPAGPRKVPTDTLLWLIREAGPRFRAADPDGACGGRDAADAAGGDDPLMARLYDAAGSDPVLARRWAGDTTGLADGSRSGLAFALGAALKRAGFGFEEMRALLRRNPHTRGWVAEKGEASGARELRRIWNRADAGTLAADPEVLAAPDLGVLRLHRRAPPILPLDVFGPWSGWVADAAKGAACPPDYVAAPLLSSASALIGNARWAQATSDWAEPPHLWCASVGDSGDGKSPGADPLFKAVIPELERRMGADFPERLREHRLAAEAAEARREQRKKDVRAAQEKGHAAPLPPADLEPQPEPQSPRLRQNDVTVEKVAALLAHAAPKGLLMVRDELAGFLLGMNAYNDGARPFWLEAYGGRPYRVERQKHPDPIDVPHLAVAWWGGVQPERLAKLMREADDGLLARFCWVWPGPIPFDLAHAAHDARWATEALDRLRLLEMALGPRPGEPARPVLVPLAEAARPHLVALGRAMQRRSRRRAG
jgi:hypothetical protein